MYKYEVGQVIDGFKNHAEGTHFDLEDDGATMVVFFNRPTDEEIEQFKEEKSFEIRFVELRDIIMVTTKIGNLSWMDATYTPHLSKNLTKFHFPNENQGLGLMLMLVDAVTGKIKHMRMLGLSERFTKRLFGSVMELKMKEFNQGEYNQSINMIFNTYDTKQLVKMSRDYCKVNA